jgi:hypothetical protein
MPGKKPGNGQDVAPDGWLSRLAGLDAWHQPCPGFRSDVDWTRSRRALLTFLSDRRDKAVALGWTAIDLLGVHPVVGVARVDYCGALLIGVSPVQLITAETIVYVNGLKFHRGTTPPDAVPIWAWSNSPVFDLQGTGA